MLGVHGETFAEQCASCATLLSKVLTVLADFFVAFLPREPKNQKSNWFDNFCLARHFAHRVRSYEHFAQHFDLYKGGQACAVVFLFQESSMAETNEFMKEALS